jgi:hypothetical protein
MSKTNVFDFMSVQHVLNFCSIKTSEDVSLHVGSEDDEDNLADVAMVAVDSAGGHIVSALQVANKAGEKTNKLVKI